MSQQIEQLYFTWSTVGYGDIPGFQLRAASPGVADIRSERYNALKPYLNYFLPIGTDAYEASSEASPRCLVYGEASREDYILAQKVYTGKDTHGRPGTYFVHMLVGLPADFVAQDAIQLWRSNFWQYWKVADDRAQGVSLDLPTIPPSTLPGAYDTYNALAKPFPSETKSFLSKIIQAYLMLTDRQKLYIAGTPDQVADLIWFLTHALPRTMQRDLTFSTYEQDVLKSSVRIVGICNPQTTLLKGYAQQPVFFPPECYYRGLIIDCEKQQVTGIDSTPKEVVEYATYTVESLLHRNKAQELAAFLQYAAQEGIDTTKSLLLHFTSEYKFSGRNSLTRDDALECFKIPRYAKHLSRDKVREILIRSALADHQWWNEQALPIIQNLPQTSNAALALRTFGKAIANELFRAMVSQPTYQVTLLLSMLLTVTSPNRDNVPWIHLLEHFHEYMNRDKDFYPTTAFDWNTRSTLLSQWILCYRAYEQEQQDKESQSQPGPFWNMPIREEIMFPWLCLKNWDELKDILDNIESYKKQRAKSNQNEQERDRNVFPSQWFNIAFTDLQLRSDEKSLPKWAIDLFSIETYSSRLLDVLMHMMESPAQQPAVLLYFRKLAESHYKNIPLVLVMLMSAGSLSDEMTEQFFAAAHLDANKKAELLENHPSHLLPDDPSPAPHTIVALVDDYLQRLTLGQLAGKNASTISHTLQFLHTRQAKLPAPIRSKVDSWIHIYIPLHMEFLSLQALNKAILDLNLHKDKDFKAYKENLLLVLVQNIATFDALRNVLEALSPALGDGNWQALLQELVTCFGASNTSQVSYERFISYIDMVLALYRHLKQKSDEDRKNLWDLYLEPLFKKVDRETFAQIDQAISSGSHSQEWIVFVNQYKLRHRQLTAFNLVEMVIQAIRQALSPLLSTKHEPPQLASDENAPRNQQANEQNASSLAGSIPPPSQPLTNPGGFSHYISEQTDPVSIVNGSYRIPRERVQMVYALKDLYIRLRLAELDREKMNSQGQDTTWIDDEQHELRGCRTLEDILRLLENDGLILQALKGFRDRDRDTAELDPLRHLDYVFHLVSQQPEYVRTRGNYTDTQMQQMLLVFLRYRVLAYFFRQQGTVSLHDWLERQRAQADIQRNVKMLSEDGDF